MRRASLWFLICVLSLSLPVAAQDTSKATRKKIAAAEKELRAFYESYAEDLRRHRREAIADRYDRNGIFIMGNGRKEHSSFEAVRNRYLNKWTGPKAFQWHDLSFDVLSPEIGIVLGRFEWQTIDEKVFKFSYTGVLVKRNGQWRIRVEDESTAQ